MPRVLVSDGRAFYEGLGAATDSGGLITEVGGMMTHGSVVAREYGIPAGRP